MKVIGLDEKGNYIAVVSHTEVEKLTNKYYGNLKKLEIGESLDLGGGYDFTGQIQSACKGMTDAMKNFNSAQKTMQQFAIMTLKLEEKENA